MAKLIATERFIEDASTVWSDAVLDHIDRALSMLETFPESGSTAIPASVRTEFGPSVRKVVVMPFDLVYEYDKDQDTVFVYRLIPCAMAR